MSPEYHKSRVKPSARMSTTQGNNKKHQNPDTKLVRNHVSFKNPFIYLVFNHKLAQDLNPVTHMSRI